jgi:hypothetical protein
MTVQMLKLGRDRFVVVSERDFKKLQRRAARAESQDRQDAGDVAEARKRLVSPRRKTIPLSRLKAELGL